jgi:pimeloyl-ACP methyl ester carboxylesterase
MKAKGRLGVGLDMRRLGKILMKSPVFKLSDMIAAAKAQKLLGHILESLLEFDAETMTEFKTPVCFVHGEKDWQVPIELTREYYEKIAAPGKGFYVVENAGHVTFVDNLQGSVAAFEAAVSQWT